MITIGWPRVARPLVGTALLALTAGSGAGCAYGGASVGGGLPKLSADEQVDADSVPFEGVLRIGPQGCLMVHLDTPTGDIKDRWTVWPVDAEQVLSATESGNGARVDGDTYADQDRITGTGHLVALADLPLGSSPGSYFEGKGRYCDALVGGVLVIDEVRHA